MEIFETEVKYLSLTIGEDDQPKHETVSRMATFKELDQTDKSQHKLHWAICTALADIFSNAKISTKEDGSEDVKMVVDPELTYDLTVKAVNTLFVKNPEKEKEDSLFISELMKDSGALFRLGQFFLTEKFTPFFLRFNNV